MDKEFKLHKEKADSVEVSKNAKGEASWKIKIYYDVATESEIDVVNKIKCIDTMLKNEFKKDK